MYLQFEKFSIRPFIPGDEPSIVEQANNRKIWIQLRDLFPHPYLMEHAVEWIRSTLSMDPLTQFAIDINGRAVGGIGIVLKDDIYRRSGEIGYWLGEKFWGRGIMTQAVSAVSDWAFSSFDICRLYAGVFEGNNASMRVLEKAGYRLEARHEKAVIKDSRTMDEIIYAMVRP